MIIKRSDLQMDHNSLIINIGILVIILLQFSIQHID